MTVTIDPPPPVKRRRWRLFILVLVPLALVAGFWLYVHLANQRLARVLAETDRLDPRWRMEDIEADRAVIPDEENGALTVLAAHAKMPANWFNRHERLQQTILVLQRSGPPTEQQIAGVRADFAPAADATALARRLADQPHGRWPAPPASLMYPLDVAKALVVDAQLRAWAGDYDGALTSLRAAVNVGRSFGDEPSLMPQMVRLAGDVMAASELETILGQGEASEAALAPLQHLLTKEGEEPLFTYALRGERARFDGQLEAVQHGKVSVKQFLGPSAPSSRFSFAKPDLLEVPGVVANSRAAILDDMNKAVEISKLPPQEQRAPCAALMVPDPFAPLQLNLIAARGYVRYMETGWEKQTRLRCAAVGLAVERYRMKHSRWPATLGDLKDEFLRDVLPDPFDGQALRYDKTEHGVVIHSIGGTSQGAVIDLRFRLRDPARRREPLEK